MKLHLYRFSAEEIGAEKCGYCNWETSIFYYLATSREEALKQIKEMVEKDEGAPLCGECMCDLLVESGYEIISRE